MKVAAAFWRILLFGLCLLALWALLLPSTIEAQANPDQCANTRFLMRGNTTPDALLVGGGTLVSATSTTGTVGAGDIGDVWSFLVENALATTGAELVFSNIASSLTLEFAVFQGMDRITQNIRYEPVTPAQSYTFPTTQNGVYTLVVRLRDFASTETMTQSASYQIRVNYQGSDNVVSALTDLRDEQTRGLFTEGRDFVLQDGRQIITFPSDATFRMNPGSLRAVSTRPNAAGQVIFPNGGSVLLDSWATSVSLVGGSLSVNGLVDETPRIFSLENFGYGGSLVTPPQSSLQDVLDSNGTFVATDWQDITGMWVLMDCMGFKMQNGTTFVIPITPRTEQRTLIARGRGTTNPACAGVFTRATAPTPAETTIEHTVCFIPQSIEPGSEIVLNQSVLDAQLIEDRRLLLQSSDIRMATREAEEGVSYPLNISLADQGVSLAFDWINLARFDYVNNQIALTFLDAPRTSTTRDGTDLLSLEAVGDVIHIVYDGTNAPERLILPADENYLEVITPGGEPTFGGEAFNGTALPGEPGYQPRALNNLGGECYPVNTTLEIANCAPNGDINPANGNLWFSVVDHTAHHPVFDLALTRSYNSAIYMQDGAFGYGWTNDFPVDYDVAFDPVASARVIDLANPETRVRHRAGLDPTWTARRLVTLTLPSGSQHTFVRQSASSGTEVFTAITMPGWRLTRTGATLTDLVRSRWTLTLPDGLTYEYDRAGRLRSVGYPAQEHQITITYPSDVTPDGSGALGDGLPVVITDSAATRQLELYYDDSHHIVRSILRDLTIADADSDACLAEQSCFEIGYEYTDGRLTQVSYPGGQTAAYNYDNIGRLIRHDDPRAPVTPVMGYVYANEIDGYVVEAYVLDADEAAPSEPLALWRRLSVSETRDERQATVTDELGNQTTYVYDLAAGDLREAGDSYTLLSTISPLAQFDAFEAVPTTYTWQNGLIVSRPFRSLPIISGRGRNSIDYGYTEGGLLSSVRGGYPGFNVGTTTVEGLPVPQNITFADGTNAQYGDYNVAGFFNSYTDRQGANTIFERDAQNRPTRITRSNDGVVWEYSYDDELGFVSALRQINTPEDPGYTVSYEWDALGRLISINDSVLGTYTIAYTPVETDASGSFSGIFLTAPDGSVTWSRFDGRGRLVETRLLPNTESALYLSRTTYEYDVFGRLTAENRWLLEDGSEQASRTTYSYTPQPELTAVGEPIHIGGTAVIRTDPLGDSTFIVYDALGRVRLRGSGQSAISRFDYDVTDPQNPDPNPIVNQNGLTILQRDYLGGVEIARTSYIFDAGWQLTAVRRTEGSPVDNPAAWTGEWRLFNQTIGDVDQRLRFLQAPSLGLEDVNWEDSFANGRAGSVTVQRDNPLTTLPENGGSMDAEYDFLGRPTQITQTVDGQPIIVSLAYCPQPSGGLKIVRSLPNQTITCETEDPAQALAYDAHNRLVSAQDASGFRTFIYTVNMTDGGTTVQMITPDDALFSWALTYDAAGNLQNWTDESGITRTYAHDTLGRLRSVAVEGEREASYIFEYNLGGLLTVQRDGLGRGTIYAYNGQGQVTLRQDAVTGNASSYTYDNRGLLVSLTSPLGSVTSYQYTDPVDPTRITGITTANGRDEFIWDDDANTLTTVDAGGRRHTYTFDSLGLLWQVSSPAGRLYNLVHDQMGRLTSWETEGESDRAISLGYDPAESLITVSESTTPAWQWNFGFAAAGQLISAVNPAQQTLGFEYDPLNRLANVRANGESIWSQTFTDQTAQVSLLDGQILSYDALYRRTQEASGDSETGYTYEASEDEGVVNVQIASPTEMQIYTFSSGDDRQPPRIALRTAGRHTLYTYNAEGLLESIDDQVCLQAPYFDLTSIPLAAFTIEDQSACESANSPNVWRSNVRILYDEIGQPIRIVDAEQAVEAFTYDGVGNLVSYQDQDGRTYNYAYDALYRLARLTTPVGVEMSLDYDLDRVSGICRSAGSADYAACVASGGTLESYTYDALGRLTEQRFPNGGGTSSIAQEYGGGLLSAWGDNRLIYAEDGFSTLERVNGTRLNYNAGNLSEAGALGFSHDANGRLTEIRTGEQVLAFQYDEDNIGYWIVDSASGDGLHFRLYPNGLLESVEYETEGEAAPALSVEYFGQETDGILPFTLNWGDDTLLDLRVNRRGEELFLDYVPALVDGLAADYVFSQRGNVARVVIASDDPAYFETNNAGYTIVLGYDQTDNPLTMRVTGANGDLLYQATYVYDTQAQLTREVREYAGGQRVQIDYTYASGGQLISRTVSQRGLGGSAASGFGILAVGMIGAVGTLRLRRLGKRVVIIVLLSVSIALVYAAVSAQEPGITVTYTYAYDERGNLVRMDANGDICTTYSYDEANHLTGIQSSVGTTEYRYDVYGRLALVDGTPLIYAGEAPLLLTSEHGSRFYTVTHDGTQLFFAENGELFPFVYSGWGQVFGTRSYGDESATSPVWLFDPFRRSLTLTPPQANADLCAAHIAAVNSNLLPIFENALWDTRNNLLLVNGRAYSPDIARFLQRDPLGPDALGRVYEYASERAAPPVRLREPIYSVGLNKLLSVIALQELGWTLDARSVAAQYLPQPSGAVESALYDQLQVMPEAYRSTLGGLMSLPSWLANDYNLPGARIDENGALRLLADNAPGHGGWGNQNLLQFDSPIWENTVWSQGRMNTPLATLAGLVGHMQLPANPLTTYAPTAWRGSTISLPDVWLVPSIDLSVDRTPAAVLTLLPRPLSGYQEALDTLALPETLDSLPSMTNRDWLDMTLDAALPTLPDLPPADLNEWREEWFSTDTFGMMEILGERYAVPPPPDVALDVTVKVGGR